MLDKGLITQSEADGQYYFTLKSANHQVVLQSEGYTSKAGADPRKVRQALMGGAAASVILDNHGGRMLDRNFAETFRVELQRKDLGLAVEAARELGMMLPNTATAWQMLNAAEANGDLKSDAISVLKVLEQLANHKLEA